MKSSGKYSGTASVQFEIERFRNTETGDLYTTDDVLPGTDEDGNIPDQYELISIPLEIEGTAYCYPAKTHGDPEFCYPADSDCEILEVSGPYKMDWEAILTSNEIDKIHDDIIDNVINYEGDDYDEDCADRDDFDDRLDYYY